MSIGKILLGGVVAAFGLSIASAQTTLFEGARLITGDGSAPIADSAFLVENNKITRVGKRGEIPLPAGANRVDLSGKRVMPAMVDAHTHVGWDVLKTGKIGAD